METFGATFTGRMRTLSRGGGAVRTRHELTVLLRGSTEAVNRARLLAPRNKGAGPAPEGAMPLPSTGPPYAAIQEALDELARTSGRPIARFAAKRLEHRGDAG